MLLSVSYQVKVVWFHRPCSGSGQHKSGLALIDSPTKWGRAVPEHLWPWWKLIGFKIKLPVMKAVWLWCPCRVPVHFLATIKIQHSDGLPITALDCSINQGYRFKAASGIPLPTFTGYPRKAGQFKVKPCGLSLLTWMAFYVTISVSCRGNPLRLPC